MSLLRFIYILQKPSHLWVLSNRCLISLNLRWLETYYPRALWNRCLDFHFLYLRLSWNSVPLTCIRSLSLLPGSWLSRDAYFLRSVKLVPWLFTISIGVETSLPLSPVSSLPLHYSICLISKSLDPSTFNSAYLSPNHNIFLAIYPRLYTEFHVFRLWCILFYFPSIHHVVCGKTFQSVSHFSYLYSSNEHNLFYFHSNYRAMSCQFSRPSYDDSRSIFIT